MNLLLMEVEEGAEWHKGMVASRLYSYFKAISTFRDGISQRITK